MTCIVGLKTKEGIWMGADSAGVGGLNLTVRSDTKIFRKGNALFAFTSSFRMGQLLHYKFKMPKHPKKMSTLRYFNTVFIDAVRKCFQEGGYMRKHDNVESGGCFIVGYRGEIACIEEDFQVGIPNDVFVADGCGGRIASGALYASLKKKSELSGKEHVKIALEASERFSAGVRRPFKIMYLENK